MVLYLSGKKVWVAGHNGMVGQALTQKLKNMDANLIEVTRGELDLTKQAETEAWILENRPDFVLVAAAKVGGILANDSYPSSFLYENLMIGKNIINKIRFYLICG